MLNVSDVLFDGNIIPNILTLPGNRSLHLTRVQPSTQAEGSPFPKRS